MSLSDATKRIVRQRANSACEYCGVSESDAGGELSVDHYRPQSKGGGDELENLVYACVRCNLYKSDYWVKLSSDLSLWNPRLEPAENHFWQADDGNLYALTEKGKISIRVLNLNRPQLVVYRQNRRLFAEERQLLEESEINLEILFRLGEEQREIIRKQQILLEEQKRLLELLLKKY